jgi:hypothetical protein
MARSLILQQVRGGLRQEHLPAVATGSNARSPVHVEADVAGLGQGRTAGVEADPQANLIALGPSAGKRPSLDCKGCL